MRARVKLQSSLNCGATRSGVAQLGIIGFSGPVLAEGVVVIVMVFVIVLGLGCSAPAAMAPPDAGWDAGAPVPDPCGNQCDGSVCSLKRCMPAPCAAAEANHTSLVGCTFYAYEAENVTSDADRTSSVLVTNPGNDTATVVLEVPVRSASGALDWLVLTGTPIGRVSSRRLSLSGRAVGGAGMFPSAGFRVSSDRPVTVALVESDDRTQGEVSSSGGTMLWPLQSIGRHYRVMTYPQQETQAIGATPGSHGGAGRLAVVATQPGTHVTVALSGQAIAVSTGLTTLGGPIVLDDGDVLQILSDAEGGDLSGTEIEADGRVAVFSGNVSTTYGTTASGINSPDMTLEQMPPIRAWSTTYVAAEVPPQANTCDSVLGASGASVWRIVATETDTRVNFTAPSGVTGLPSSTITMAPGDVRMMVVAGGSFTIKATKPVLVTQGIDCEPTLSLAISSTFLRDYRFATLPHFDQVAAVVRRGTDDVALDGVVLDRSLFRSAGEEYEVALLPLPKCPAAEGACTHRLQGNFGLTLRGMDVFGSWAFTVPTASRCIDPIDSCID
jgi:hypothetical protein